MKYNGSSTGERAHAPCDSPYQWGSPALYSNTGPKIWQPRPLNPTTSKYPFLQEDSQYYCGVGYSGCSKQSNFPPNNYTRCPYANMYNRNFTIKYMGVGTGCTESFKDWLSKQVEDGTQECHFGQVPPLSSSEKMQCGVDYFSAENMAATANAEAGLIAKCDASKQQAMHDFDTKYKKQILNPIKAFQDLAKSVHSLCSVMSICW